jgi:Rrf2 family protein
MARALRIPQEYLAKILRRLARAGVLISTRGKAGGFRLAAPPQRVRLHAIVAPFDDLGGPRRCLLGRPHCSDRFACAAHDRWRRVADAMNEFLRQTTLADVARNGAPTE